MGRTMTAAEVRAKLDDERYRVTPVPGDAPSGTLAWVRANVPRFCEGAAHARRREIAERLLAGMEPAGLRSRAAERTRSLRRSLPEEQVIDAVPVLLLAEQLGMLESRVDELALVRATLRLGTCYLPHLPQIPDVDAEAALLLEAAGGDVDKESATRVSFLLQACPATANLVRHARRGRRSIEETLRTDTPVRSTRRIAPDEELVELDMGAPLGEGEPLLAFGSGRHGCPGHAQAVAIASGILDGLGEGRVTIERFSALNRSDAC